MEKYSPTNRKKPDVIIVLGVQLREKDFPVLFEWALRNPTTLMMQLQSIADKWHGGDRISAAQALESDLKY